MILRGAAAAFVAALALGTSSAHAADGDMALGRADAPVTVVEYASVTCSHCAHWQAEVWPAFKAKWIDTGKVRYVLRELPTNPRPLAVDGFLVARCAGPDRYFDVVDRLMADQKTIFQEGDREAWLTKASGLTPQAVQACVDDPAAQEAFEDRVRVNLGEHAVAGTPSFFVDGKQVGDGFATLQDLEAAVQPRLKKGR